MAARLSRIHSHLAHTVASPAGAVAPPPAAPSRLPSPCSAEDVASFRADGYLLLPGLIPAVELAAVEFLLERLDAGNVLSAMALG